MTKKIVIIGTSQIAKRLIGKLIATKFEKQIFLLGRDKEKTAFIVDDFNLGIIGVDNKDTEVFCGENSDIKDANVIVITAGESWPVVEFGDRLAELPFSAAIIKEYASLIKQLAPDALVLTVTNPLDIITLYLLEETGFKPEKVLGIGATLDSKRYTVAIRDLLEKEGFPVERCGAITVGPHSGRDMVPLRSSIVIDGIPLKESQTYKSLSKTKLNELLNEAEENTYSAGFKIAQMLSNKIEPGDYAIEVLIYLLKSDKDYIEGMMMAAANEKIYTEDRLREGFAQFLLAFDSAYEFFNRLAQLNLDKVEEEDHLLSSHEKNLLFSFIKVIGISVLNSKSTLYKEVPIDTLLYVYIYLQELKEDEKGRILDFIAEENAGEMASKIVKNIGLRQIRTASNGPAFAILEAIKCYFNLNDSSWGFNILAQTEHNKLYSETKSRFNLLPVSVYLSKNRRSSYGINDVCTGVLVHLDGKGAVPVDIIMSAEEKNKFINTARELKKIKKEYGSLKQLVLTGKIIKTRLEGIVDSKARKAIYFNEINDHKQRVKAQSFFSASKAPPFFSGSKFYNYKICPRPFFNNRVNKPEFSSHLPRFIKLIK